MAPSYPSGDDYQVRFDALAASGQDVHGEATFVETLLGPGPGVSVLDAGCGTGRVGIELARRGFGVTGTDRDPEMLATARRLAPGIDWIEADLASLDLSRTFDAIVMAGNVLLFVDPGTQPVVLRRCAAHLAGGARIITGFSLRGYTAADLDRDAAGAGLLVAARYSTWAGAPWTPADDYAVTVLH